MRTQLLSSRLLVALAASCALAPCSMAASTATLTQQEALAKSTQTMEQLVQTAREGKINGDQLRAQRIRVERNLNENLTNSPVATRAREQAAVHQARTDLNQQIMRSQEFEFFGPEDRPEWGWYPSRTIQSSGSVLTVDSKGKAVLTPVKK